MAVHFTQVGIGEAGGEIVGFGGCTGFSGMQGQLQLPADRLDDAGRGNFVPSGIGQAEFDVGSLLERGQVQGDPQAFPIRAGFGAQVEQARAGGRQSRDVWVIDEKLHAVIITRNRLSYRWYNSGMVTKLTHLDDTGRAHMVDMGDKPDTERLAYIGITLARAEWGKGYGEEASRRLLDYLFGELNLHRVVAECDVENAASFALLERLGFRHEAHLIENIWFKGGWGSKFHYAMLEREWQRT